MPWEKFNADGLALAKDGDWSRANDTFAEALRLVEVRNADGSDVSVAHDDARARLLLNIGQCHFHMGLLEEARRFAERSCALRVSLYGEDSLVVARTRGDLAVILAALGQTDNAMSLLERAVATVERNRGADSAYLLPLLTNAGSLLARTAPARAEPYLARLKALLFAQRLVENARHFPPSEVPAHSFGETTHSSGDDHLLREAVAQTVDLLRSTPTANIAAEFTTSESVTAEFATPESVTAEFATPESVTAEFATPESVTAEFATPDVVTAEFATPESVTAEFATPADTVDTLPPPAGAASGANIKTDVTVPALPGDVVVLPSQISRALLVADADSDAAVVVAWEYEAPLPAKLPETIAPVAAVRVIDDALFDLVEPPPPTLSAIPRDTAKPDGTGVNALGFEVEYGIPSQLHESLVNPTTPLPNESTGAELSDAYATQPLPVPRSGQRAVGGVRRGKTQFVAMNRLWSIAAPIAAFGGGVGAFFLYRFIKTLVR